MASEHPAGPTGPAGRACVCAADWPAAARVVAGHTADKPLPAISILDSARQGAGVQQHGQTLNRYWDAAA
ncbi:MAG: hypothetical protein ACRDOH_24165, partial [Streptosporangiaceae bacterium]